MSDFNTAIRMLRQGKKVRRPCWEEDSYWTLGVDEIILWANQKKAVVHLNQIEANDWEIYQNKDNSLSSWILRDGDGYPCIRPDKAKNFIRLLKFWGRIDLGTQTLTINYNKFKELVGEDLI